MRKLLGLLLSLAMCGLLVGSVSGDSVTLYVKDRTELTTTDSDYGSHNFTGGRNETNGGFHSSIGIPMEEVVEFDNVSWKFYYDNLENTTATASHHIDCTTNMDTSGVRVPISNTIPSNSTHSVSGSEDLSIIGDRLNIHFYPRQWTNLTFFFLSDDYEPYIVINYSPLTSPVADAGNDINPNYDRQFLTSEVWFGLNATEGDGAIVLYEWDFDGDGAFDWSSDVLVSQVSYTYQFDSNTKEDWTHYAAFRVTDEYGYSHTDYRWVNFTKTDGMKSGGGGGDGLLGIGMGDKIGPVPVPVVVGATSLVLIGGIGAAWWTWSRKAV